MADIREEILIDNMGARLFRSPAWGALATRVKLAMRGFVVATSPSPLGAFYDLVYRAHVWYGVRALRKLPGVRAIYVTRGVASGDIVHGISDVDFAVFGDWTDETYANVQDALRRLSASSPLYERELWREARTVESIRSLYESDFSLMCRLDEGRTRWALRHGEHVLAILPPPPVSRVAGGYYMELRLWWSYFTRTAFGSGAMATDTVFRNSLCYKVVSESLAKIAALEGEPVEPLRRKALAAGIDRAPAEHRTYLGRLRKSSERGHRRYDGEIHEDTWRFLLPTLEQVQAVLGNAPAFAAVPSAAALQIDAVASEMLRTRDADARAAQVVAHVKTSWAGYRAAFLTPCLSFYNPDDLLLLLEVDPSQPPSVAQIRELQRLQAASPNQPRQRLTLFLLLAEGAYQIETAGPLDLWHLLMCRSSNPELFDLITRQEFVLDGTARSPSPAPVWTLFAAALVEEEIAVRRSAMAKVSTAPAMTPLDLLRNIWRHLQLEAIVASTLMGRPTIPLTLGAIARALEPLGLFEPSLVGELKDAYHRGLAGEEVDIRPQMARLMGALAQGANSI